MPEEVFVEATGEIAIGLNTMPLHLLVDYHKRLDFLFECNNGIITKFGWPLA